MADPKLPPPADPLGTIQGMFEGVLIQTGKFFQAATANKTELEPAANVLRSFLPVAQKRFHEALDELEIELLKAKAVFEQDLLDVRAKNRPKEPTIVTEEVNPTAGLVEGAAEESLTHQSNAGGGVQDDEQTTQNNQATADSTAADEPMQIDEGDATVVDVSLNPTADQSHTTDIKISPPKPSKPQEVESTLAKTQATLPVTIEQPQEEVPTSAVSQDLNFDSMFDAPTGGTGDINAADLDFLNDFKVDPVPEGSTGSNDLNSLLPGLESYANAAGDDFTMIFPSNTAEGLGTTNKPAQAMFDGMDLGNDMPAQESNFDDMFLEGGDLGNDDDFLNDASLGEIGDFDDSLFDSKDFNLS